MPVVDEYRELLEKTFRERVSRTVLDDLTQQERARGTASLPRRSVLELGDMAWAVQNGKVQLPRPEKKLLFILREVRNALAHLQPISDEMLEHLARALPRDG